MKSWNRLGSTWAREGKTGYCWGYHFFRPLSVYRRSEIFMNSSFLLLASQVSFLLFFLIFKLHLQHSFNLLACSYPCLSYCLSIHLSLALSQVCYVSPNMQDARGRKSRYFAPIAQVEHNRWLAKWNRERFSTDLRNTLRDQTLILWHHLHNICIVFLVRRNLLMFPQRKRFCCILLPLSGLF